MLMMQSDCRRQIFQRKNIKYQKSGQKSLLTFRLSQTLKLYHFTHYHYQRLSHMDVVQSKGPLLCPKGNIIAFSCIDEKCTSATSFYCHASNCETCKKAHPNCKAVPISDFIGFLHKNFQQQKGVFHQTAQLEHTIGKLIKKSQESTYREVATAGLPLETRKVLNDVFHYQQISKISPKQMSAVKADIDRHNPVNKEAEVKQFCDQSLNAVKNIIAKKEKLLLGSDSSKKPIINIVVFEAEGGSDKGYDGHRKDSQPIVDQINKIDGYHCDIIFYRDEWSEKLYDVVKDKYRGYIPRVNPGTIPTGQTGFFNFLRKLSSYGLVGMPHPDAMTRYGAKDALVKLAGTSIVPADTYGYYKVEDLHKNFPVTLSTGERVLKQNRGSTGSGIWRVRLANPKEAVPGKPLPLNTNIICTEAVDNHVENRKLGEFMKFCEQYIIGENGQLVDMRFLPRIKQGEIRILLVGSTPVFVVHKKPAEGSENFSATLFSGAKYTYDKPDKWPILMKNFDLALPQIKEKLGNLPTPLIWCSDFILDWNADKTDRFILGEINCSCVGFTSQLDYGIQQLMAKEVADRVKN